MSTTTDIQYLFKLSSPVETEAKLHEVLQDDKIPVIEILELEEPPALYAYMTPSMLFFLLKEFPKADFPFYTTRKLAAKNLSKTSLSPTLGIETTLAQQRAPIVKPRPRQNEYPVCYFFYGTLSEPALLARVLGAEAILTSEDLEDGAETESQDNSTTCYESHPDGGFQEVDKEEELDQCLQLQKSVTLAPAPMLTPACILRGKVRLWRGKYAALVDGVEDDLVQGWAYEVTNKEDEDILREYVGGTYDVVRCEISVREQEGLVKGLTFRFCGKKRELEGEVEEGSEEDDGEESEEEVPDEELPDENISDDEESDEDEPEQEDPDGEELEELGSEDGNEEGTEEDHHEDDAFEEELEEEEFDKDLDGVEEESDEETYEESDEEADEGFEEEADDAESNGEESEDDNEEESEGMWEDLQPHALFAYTPRMIRYYSRTSNFAPEDLG
ncbi:uncharacterized protein N0V89_001314 [Didymosphaeria variabile]|uniref:Gamma-glutamylcyclotransferase AIG2-like domain-containing protein n=1 Tax=Didymosphaeria variabile TaxID=1932322 RepID=A0A9W8XYG0_9PLEO|nr:uncharacterized protein N0V89_001314 [Didymosphaeria variabile]KAJ4360747.1 hypothetical protein N0V89_001314 [Didymosphaeria variabile]